ncbi:hypothetical protein DEA8626_00530 [Defluviimonas aquaemixtae]|uniref:ABM domain-containing protein n=1 Tax=Albidovulum aquaemixtae TaxID=1542388 RepID=A0A2R8B310_9RHOB|nr:hypothetical protein [Defluviimonas aquaemixtae]SPH17016.1 hypothetical protein DEA8626_00530 [Defluviimonas aquaemixtae]
MHITITTFDYPDGKRGEIEAFCKSIADRVKALGPKTSVLVDLGEGTAANVAIYADAAAAERGGEGAMALYEAAGKAGLITPGTVNRRHGDVLFDYLK